MRYHKTAMLMNPGASTFLIRLLFVMAVFAGRASGEQLTLERLYGSPSLNGKELRNVKISPDGLRVTYLKGKESNSRQMDLWEYNLHSKTNRLLVDSEELTGRAPEKLSEEEKSRRERQRIQDSGIVEYYWDAEGKALLFPSGGDIYYKPLAGEVRRLTDSEASETDVKASPKGRYVSFIREQDVFVLDLATGKEKQLTFDGDGPISNGVAEFVAQEEMDRYTGYWWSPDDRYIAFTRIDESAVLNLTRYEINADGSVTTVTQRYPRAGTPNVLIRLGVISLQSGETQWIDLGPDKDIYLARVNWLPDSKRLAFQRQSRDQKRIDLIFADVESGREEPILTESSNTWTNLSDDLRFFEHSDRFLWTSEKDGFRHVYLYSTAGKEIRRLTSGNWAVAQVKGLDEEKGAVYFEGFADTPLENHLYAVPVSGGALTRVTSESGWHNTEISVKGHMLVDSYSSSVFPLQVSVKRLDGKVLAEILKNPLDKTHPYYVYLPDHAGREFGKVNAEDGTVLYYSLMKPPHYDPNKKYPAVVDVYGGPTGHDVSNTWSLGFDQYLARNGYVVFQIDNRGTADRGKVFAEHLYHDLGSVEVRDQLRGVEFLKTLTCVDANRIGVYGWSYGGYMTLLLLLKSEGVFKAGFAGAPVTDWRLYDTHYTERYMGDPSKEDDAYEQSSVYPYLDRLKSSLLLIHGMADDNVFFDHSVKLVAELQKRQILFELMTYPGERHGIYDRSKGIHRWKTAFDFFERRLKGE